MILNVMFHKLPLVADHPEPLQLESGVAVMMQFGGEKPAAIFNVPLFDVAPLK